MYTPEYLKDFTQLVFEKMGCPKDDAIDIANVFVKAELRNLPSHGMIRINDYFQLWEAGRINTKPSIKIVHETPGTAVVDADGAIGIVGAIKSMRIAIDKAKNTVTGWVATQNSNHLGIGSYYAMMALEYDMIGITMTNANPMGAPTNSTERMLGTNPITVAVPSGEQADFVADFSTTPIARGKLAVASARGEQIPFGYVQDKDGNPSDDPDIMKKGGSMLPLGGDLAHGSHKGYALGAIVDIFTGVLSGANYGPFVPPFLAYLPMPDTFVGKGMGHFFGAMRIDGFSSSEEFKKRMDNWILTIKNSKPIKGKEVLIPGEIEKRAEEILLKEGIKVLPVIQNDLKVMARKLGLDFEVKN